MRRYRPPALRAEREYRVDKRSVGTCGWGFAPPGAVDSVLFGFPGANGNYTSGQTSSLQGVSALCSTSKVAIFKRQDGVFLIVFGGGLPPDFSLLRGVWSGCE